MHYIASSCILFSCVSSPVGSLCCWDKYMDFPDSVENSLRITCIDALGFHPFLQCPTTSLPRGWCPPPSSIPFCFSMNRSSNWFHWEQTCVVSPVFPAPPRLLGTSAHLFLNGAPRLVSEMSIICVLRSHMSNCVFLPFQVPPKCRHKSGFGKGRGCTGLEVSLHGPGAEWMGQKRGNPKLLLFWNTQEGSILVSGRISQGASNTPMPRLYSWNFQFRTSG